MKRTAAAAAIAAALLLLAGCSTGAQENVTLVSEPVGSPAPSSAAPLTAETPVETPTEAPDKAAYVAEVRDTLRAENVIPNATDEQLVAAGQEACQLRASGTAPEDITVIAGETRSKSGYFLDSFKIYSAASKDLC